MTIKDTVRKYTNELKQVTHIPAKEVEILMLHLLEKNIILLIGFININFWIKISFNDNTFLNCFNTNFS